MTFDWNPMRWPSSWNDPSLLGFLKESGINCLWMDQGENPGSLAEQARETGFQLISGSSPLPPVSIIKGEWPGVKLTESGTVDRTAAGPTGNPWIDSNGWKIRLARACKPEEEVWVDTIPQKPRRSASDYRMAIADAAAHGGRWILTLDDWLAAGLADRQAQALETWKIITETIRFFSTHKKWSGYRPRAVIGILSDFSGRNEFMSHELLNLIARTNQQYLIIPKVSIRPSALAGLRAILYADEDPPAPELRKQILSFVRAGGLLITGPRWGSPPGLPWKQTVHPRYILHTMGRGHVAMATPDFEDPYLVANDSVVLVSHRHDLVRFWNGGAIGSYCCRDPTGNQALIHLLFYAATSRNPQTTLRVAGRYRSALLHTPDEQNPRDLQMERQKDALELYLPHIPGYAGIELTV